MKLTCVMVQTLDSKITKWDGITPDKWVSKQDQAHFFASLRATPVHIMGRNTYSPNYVKPRAGFLKLVVTSKPDQFKDQLVTGQLEFTNLSPQELIKDLEQKGHSHALLLGGSRLNTSFFKAGLVDELLLTLEPKLFGQGLSFITSEPLDVNLKLEESTQLNPQGTLLLRYSIIK